MRRVQKSDSRRGEGKPRCEDEYFIVDPEGEGGAVIERRGGVKVASIDAALELVEKHNSSTEFVGVYYACYDEIFKCHPLYLVTSVCVNFWDKHTIEVENMGGGRLLFDVGEWGRKLYRGAKSLRYQVFRADERLVAMWRAAHSDWVNESNSIFRHR